MKAGGALMVLNMITNISVIEQQCFLFRAVFTDTLHFEHCNVCHCSLKLQHHKHLNHLFDWANNCPNRTTQLATFFFFSCPHFHKELFLLAWLPGVLLLQRWSNEWISWGMNVIKPEICQENTIWSLRLQIYRFICKNV